MTIDRRVIWGLGLILGLAAGGHAQDGPTKDLASVLRPFVDRRELAGAVVLVADGDKVLDLEAVGSADIAEGKAMRGDALFWIASMSKPIAASAVMMLADEGKLKLDDPVGRYLPEFRDVWLAAERADDHITLRRPGHAITIREILSHTSGLPYRSAIEAPTFDRLPLDVMVASYAMTPLQFEPGSKYLYSNSGINAAGRIVELVSGVPYDRFLQDRLFGPLGMVDTTFRPINEQLTRLATSYKPGPDKVGLEPTTITQLTYPLDGPHRRPLPGGGLFSTAADLARFCRMILNDGELDGKRYLTPSSVKEMSTCQTAPSLKESYGLGWQVGGGTIGHGGAYATNMTIDPAHGLVTIFLVQHAGFPGEGGKAEGVFRKAATERFGRASR